MNMTYTRHKSGETFPVLGIVTEDTPDGMRLLFDIEDPTAPDGHRLLAASPLALQLVCRTSEHPGGTNPSDVLTVYHVPVGRSSVYQTPPEEKRPVSRMTRLAIRALLIEWRLIS